MLRTDTEAVGLRVGLEIHQQLDTAHKLFCNCPTRLSKGEPKFRFVRRLRPTQSELGQTDPAALFEFQKGRTIIYEADCDTSCLVEMDEEPPHELNPQAVDVCLQVALLLGAKPVDEIHVMRKIVVDGSNTSGFQRTCVIALGGSISVGGREIAIQTICLEEDAARKVEERGFTTTYRIDRLGIPLIEVTTAPDIHTPVEAGEVALVIGRVLRATRMVKRGIGTIRQDLNISIREGALVEVKGVQKLELIPKVIEFEVGRQLALLKIREELLRRGVSGSQLEVKPVDVTDVFRNSESRVIRKALGEGGVALAVKLPGFAEILKVELEPNVRFGTEMADRAKFWGKVGGIFHTDELPAYGITEAETAALRSKLDLSDLDAGVLVADKLDNATEALRAVVERAIEAVKGVPEETRAALLDGTTRYMRPRPGAARMYPETDVLPVVVTPQHLHKLRGTLPPLPEQLANRLMSEYSVNKKLAEQLIDSDYLTLFEKVASTTNIPSTFLATALTEVVKSLERQGVPVENLTEEQLYETFRLIEEGRMAKESFAEVAGWLAKNGGSPLEAIEKLGVKMLSVNEIQTLVDRRASENLQLLRDKPYEAFNLLMKIIMAEVRGRVDAGVVARKVKEKIESLKAKQQQDGRSS
ncbi:MAG: Glu-tRNA(Gln) amidotransferase subunit GatE [Candidatus Bathyarchaeia archaeon]